jgi:hypothetical protein
MKILFFAAMLVAHQHTAEMKFREMQDDGLVVYNGDDIDTGRPMFTLILNDGSVIEHAYREEVINYINTNEFKYDDFQ